MQKCSKCGDPIEKNNCFQFEGEIYCSHCYWEYFSECCRCGTEDLKELLYRKEDFYYCENCYHDQFNDDKKGYHKKVDEHE